MSQIPPSEMPPTAHISYASTDVATPDPRPKSLKVIAILSIVIGALTTIFTAFTAGGFRTFEQRQMGLNQITDAVRSDKLLCRSIFISMLIRILTSQLAIRAGADAWRLKVRARSALIWYGILTLLTTVLNLVANLLFIDQRMFLANERVLNVNGVIFAPAMQATMKIRTIGTVGESVLLMIWGTVLIFYMTRPYMIAAFANTRRSELQD